MDPSVSLFLLERWRKIHHGGWRWTLYYSRNRSRLTYVCHSSVISTRGPASPFRPTILRSLKSSQFVSRTAMKPRRIVAESPRRISFRETIEGNHRLRTFYTRKSRKTWERFDSLQKGSKRFSIQWCREFDIFDTVRCDEWIVNISIDTFLERRSRKMKERKSAVT